ncbi:MAG: hypothetical protein ABIJ16_06335 [Bacteroidota bacterium]
MKPTIIVICSLILLVAVSCKKKDENILISGLIQDPLKEEVVSGVRVILSGQIFESGTYNATYTKLEEVISGSDGKFSFDLENQKIGNFKLSFFKDRYFESSSIFSSEDVVRGEDYYDVYPVYNQSVLILYIKNNWPQNSGDYMKYTIQGEMLICSLCCGNSDNEFNGTSINLTRSCQIPGNQHIIIKRDVVKNENPTVHYDTLFIQAFDTTSLNIYY